MSFPLLTPLATSLPDTVPFVGPESLERTRNRGFSARIGANESGFGPSPKVIAAMAKAAQDMWKYCDPENHDLRQALARHHGVKPENIVIGEGIDGLLGLAVRLYVEPGRTVVTSLGAYATFNFHVTGFGGRLVSVPYRNDREDLQGLLDAAKSQAPAIVYLSNPDNPMGTWWEAADIERFMGELPENALFILDEAYGETAPQSALPKIDISRPNILRMRTFSKAYGLAGLRVGYAIGAEDTIRAFEKVRNHFGVNRMAQAAALAALDDQDYLREVVGKVTEGRALIGSIVRENGLNPLPSATNFVTVDCGRDGAYAQGILEGLIARDVFVRKPMAPILDRCIRISVGSAAELEFFSAALRDVLASRANQ